MCLVCKHTETDGTSSAARFSPTLHTQRGGAKSKERGPVTGGGRTSAMTLKVYPPADRVKPQKREGPGGPSVGVKKQPSPKRQLPLATSRQTKGHPLWGKGRGEGQVYGRALTIAS